MPEPTPGLPPADYSDLLSRIGRRRGRRRTALLTAGPAALLVVAVALSSSPAGGQAMLLTDQPPAGRQDRPSPSPSQSTSASPKPSESSLLPVPLPTVPPLPLPTQGTQSPSPKPTPSETETQPEPAHTQADDPAEYTYLADGAPDGCSSTVHPSYPDSANWCQRYSGPASVVSGSRDVVVWDLCRAATAGSGVLTRRYDPDKWLKTAASSSATDDHWYWAGAAEPAGVTITVAAGDCVRWTVPFHVVDEHSGAGLEPGDYALAVAFFVKEYVPSDRRTPITVTKK